uniref:transposase n=1 Tax=Spartinivicinus ruber TaxID=2683272 RepID=UPI001E5F3F8C|nr:transposase [Spartinivicinus ruber]
MVDEEIPFCVRIPNNTQVWNKHRNQQFPVSRMFGLQQGEQMSLNKQREIWGIPVYLSCMMGKQGRVIVATNDQPKTAIERYSIRWSIETLFGCLKSRGFNLEATHLKHYERLDKLFFVLALAFGWCFTLGIWQNTLKPIKLKKHGRKSKSLFRIGIDYLHRLLVEGRTKIQQFHYCLKVILLLLRL